MAQFLKLPNEIINSIFENLSLHEIWNFQQCSILCERALDPHMLARYYAVAKLMMWGCEKGIPWAIKKALSHGADINAITIFTRRPRTVYRCLTIVAAGDDLETIGLLLDLGARLDLKDDKKCRRLRRTILDPDNPQILQVCLDHGAKDQIVDFQTGLDECLFSAADTKTRLKIPHCVERPEFTWEKCEAWLKYGANPTKLLENHTETAIERAVSNGEDESDPSETIALVNLLLSATKELQAPKVEVYRQYIM
ncbi:hypothetical protein ACHAPQ_009119 [Fusarium lateritium]